MVSQCTKYGVSRFTRCEAVNGGAKCRKWGGLGWLGSTQGQRQCNQSAYDFIFNFNRNYVSIFYRFRDIAGYLSKVADFDPPHLHLAPRQGVTPVEFRGDLWHQKTRVFGGIVCCCLCDLTFSRFSRTPNCDGQTDRHRAMASTADAQHRAVIKLSETSNWQYGNGMASQYNGPRNLFATKYSKNRKQSICYE